MLFFFIYSLQIHGCQIKLKVAAIRSDTGDYFNLSRREDVADSSQNPLLMTNERTQNIIG